MTPDFRSNNTRFRFKPQVFLQVYSSLDAEYPCYSRLMGLIDRFPAGNPIHKKRPVKPELPVMSAKNRFKTGSSKNDIFENSL